MTSKPKKNIFRVSVAFILSLSMLVAVPTTGACEGPLYQIFQSWQDATQCIDTVPFWSGSVSRGVEFLGILVMLAIVLTIALTSWLKLFFNKKQ
jgi:hypothetical protein